MIQFKHYMKRQKCFEQTIWQTLQISKGVHAGQVLGAFGASGSEDLLVILWDYPKMRHQSLFLRLTCTPSAPPLLICVPTHSHISTVNTQLSWNPIFHGYTHWSLGSWIFKMLVSVTNSLRTPVQRQQMSVRNTFLNLFFFWWNSTLDYVCHKNRPWFAVTLLSPDMKPPAPQALYRSCKYL